MSVEESLLTSVYDCLSNQRRRYILTYLSNTKKDSASVGTLVDHVVERETNSPSPNREDVATALHHIHLPKLADNGLINYDTKGGVVVATDRLNRLEQIQNGEDSDTPTESVGE